MTIDPQLAAQATAVQTPPRPGYLYRMAHVDGRVSNHKRFASCVRTWRVGDVVYQWHEGRWAIWTSAGLI